MKVSLSWLRDYVDLPGGLSPSQLMHDLTLSTVEVEGIDYAGRHLEHICVGKLVSTEPVSGTHLSLTRVDAGAHGVLQVVCGAPATRAGMKVILALPGARIQPKGAAHPIEVKVVEIRGMRSEGVLCAADEAGLAAVFPPTAERGIVDLEEVEAVPGTPLAEAIGFDDAVLEIDNKSLTNRPDLWGHHGIARELSAIYRVPLRGLPALPAMPAATGLLGASDPAICNRFTATVLDGVTAAPAPLWMRSRLARVGQRSIDLFVDLTNYVMFATGQPSHAYDADRVSAPMKAAWGRAGESLELLDGSKHDVLGLPCIVDARGVLAAAGVMGGAISGVTDSTRRIFLEMASFDAGVVRRSSQRIGSRTEASSRFEKGVDSQRIDGALGLFLDLVKSIQPGVRCTGFQDAVNQQTARARIDVAIPFIESRLGKNFPAGDIEDSLERLGLDVARSGEVLSLTAPTWRSTGDLSLPADIVEEVARLHGYDNFRIVPPRIDLARMPRDRRLPLDRRVREYLAQAGLQEVFTYPWANASMLTASGVDTDSLFELEAPPAPEQRFLRGALVPNLVEAVALNQHNFESFGLFESGAVFPGRSEAKHVAGVLFGPDLGSLFARGKGLIEGLVRKVHLHRLTETIGGDNPGWADAAVAISWRSATDVAGRLARVGNRTRRAAGIKRGELVAFEFDLGRLSPHLTRENGYVPLPEFPETRFDVTSALPDAARWSDVKIRIGELDERIRDVVWIGEYRGKGVPDGHRALTFRVHLALSDRTLTAEEGETVRGLVGQCLKKAFGAVDR